MGVRCEHNRQRAQCKDCKGASICEHARIRYRCKDCGGIGICQHERRKDRCALCHPAGGFSYYKREAKRRGIPFMLTLEEFTKVVLSPCRYCGEPAGGVDRLDNSHDIGYTPSNSVPCCAIDNQMKMDLTEGCFIARIQAIYRNLK